MKLIHKLYKSNPSNSYMKKQAKDLKKGDKIKIANKDFLVDEIEISEIGKHGKRKVRVVAVSITGEKMIVIRPEDYPFDSE